MPEFPIGENEIKIGLTEIDRDRLDRNGGITFPDPVTGGEVEVYYIEYMHEFGADGENTVGLCVRPKTDYPEMQEGKDGGRTWSGGKPEYTLYWTSPRFLGSEPIDDDLIDQVKESTKPLDRI